MYPNRSTCRQIQDFVAGYKIHVARYKIHAGYMLPATCRQCVPGLNLSGDVAAESCVQAVTFFGVIRKLYEFLSFSTSRWNVLMEKLKTTDSDGTH